MNIDITVSSSSSSILVIIINILLLLLLLLLFWWRLHTLYLMNMQTDLFISLALYLIALRGNVPHRLKKCLPPESELAGKSS